MAADPRALSFGAIAGGYAAARPSYPAALVAWLAPGQVVADVGAGTGKLTSVLLAAGREVIAIEPDPQMLDELRAAYPEVAGHVAPAEELPLVDGSVDAVVYAQSWHWVDEGAAGHEAGRVVRPGGTAGAIWNVPDASAADWVAELTALRGPSAGQARGLHGPDPAFGDAFGPCERREERWDRPTDVDAVVALIGTRSDMVLAATDERERALGEVRRIATAAAAADPSGRLVMPYLAIGYRATRLS
ncbi:MAG: class I SAM-dependent methyltransferase [Solirubrobacteraceae bacterium]|nr:class I SAM-dependent methyltransferase [Solirubrobacteraceae bacterium]